MAFPERFSYAGDYGALAAPVEKVMVALSRLNKWADTLYTVARDQFGCAELGRYIHRTIAHEAPRLYDRVSGILAQRHLPNVFPPTEALENRVVDLDEVFEVLIAALDGVGEGLRGLTEAARGGESNALALQFEEVQVEVSRLYTGVLELWKVWSTGPGVCTFDAYVGKYNRGSDVD